jgi:c-di-GMP-binding flagellar brake protein YcgR
MNTQPPEPLPPGIDRDAVEMLTEIERSTPDEVRRQRAHDRIQIRAKIIVQPGNTSQRTELKLQGITSDISRGGCQALFPLPLQVGDIYRLQFDQAAIAIGPVLARCMRCRFVRDDAFEVGVAFLQNIELPEVNQKAA